METFIVWPIYRKVHYGWHNARDNFDLSGEVENAFYDRISLGTVNGEGHYSNKQLKFNQFSSSWNG